MELDWVIDQIHDLCDSVRTDGSLQDLPHYLRHDFLLQADRR